MDWPFFSINWKFFLVWKNFQTFCLKLWTQKFSSLASKTVVVWLLRTWIILKPKKLFGTGKSFWSRLGMKINKYTEPVLSRIKQWTIFFLKNFLDAESFQREGGIHKFFFPSVEKIPIFHYHWKKLKLTL